MSIEGSCKKLFEGRYNSLSSDCDDEDTDDPIVINRKDDDKETIEQISKEMIWGVGFNL